MRSVPAPSIFAPILLRKFARSTTSGSHAAPSMTVTPSASTAAIITLSVPSTVGPNLPCMLDLCPAQFRRKNFDVTALHAHCGAERFEAFQVQINWPIANDATAGQGDRRFLAPAQQRPENTNGRAHFPNDVVRRNRMDLFRRHSSRCRWRVPPARRGASGFAACNSCRSDRARHGRRMAPRVSNVAARIGSEEFFEPLTFDRTGKATAAVHQNFIHTSRTGNVSHLSNPFQSKCRGNFFRPMPTRSASLWPIPISSANIPPGRSQRRRLRNQFLAPARPRARLRKAQLQDRAKLREKGFAVVPSRCREDLRRSDRTSRSVIFKKMSSQKSNTAG